MSSSMGDLAGWAWCDPALPGDPLSALSCPVSVKFISKIQYVHSLEELEQLIPMEHVQLPECVLQ